jgi:hypothetical protein
MRRYLLDRGHLFSTLLVSLLVLSTHLLWAQITQPIDDISVRLFDGPIQPAPDPEARTHLGPVPEGLALSPEPQARLFSPFTSYCQPTNHQAASNLQHPTGLAELLGKAKYFTGSASSQWLRSADARVHYPTIHSSDHLQYYGHRIPWAGPMVLRVSQQAKAHPHITGVLKLLQPQF